MTTSHAMIAQEHLLLNRFDVTDDTLLLLTSLSVTEVAPTEYLVSENESPLEQPCSKR